MDIKSCKFVVASDLMADVSEAFYEEMAEVIGRQITWGDANRTMIDVATFAHCLDEARNGEYDPDCVCSNLIQYRLDGLPNDVDYIDLEN